MSRTFIASYAESGLRLDAALAKVLPNFSLRSRRRLIEIGGVLVNGIKARPGLKIKYGSCVEIPDIDDECVATDSIITHYGIKFLDMFGDYCFYFKPSGIHSTILRGKNNDSLEKYAAKLLYNEAHIYGKPELLQRLDYNTEGIIGAALNTSALVNFKTWEKKGNCHKFYLTLLNGILHDRITINYSLSTDNRKKIKALEKPAPPIRSTTFIPLKIIDSNLNCKDKADTEVPKTLALCHIQAGQRHQIRVHSACAGFALWGDELYGQQKADKYYLTHFYLKFPAGEIYYLNNESLLGKLAKEIPLKNICDREISI